MKKIRWNDNWKFWADKDAFALIWNVPESAQDITLPHDAMIENKPYAGSPNRTSTGFRDGDCYTYVKLFTPEESWREKIVQVYFEGVYMNAMVYLNGQFIAKNPYGYTGFTAQLNSLLRFGEVNELRVLVRNGAMNNSRWYSGSGIYRDVWLQVSGLSRIVPQGVQVRTEEIREDAAVLKVTAEIENRGTAPEEMVLETVLRDPSGAEAGGEKTSFRLVAGEKRTVMQRILVEDPKCWSDESPDLYGIETVLKTPDGKELDRDCDHIGIRKLSLDAKKGLQVNGRSVKLRGACIHHDSGILGAATYEDAQYRQVKLLKEAGFNAIRMSHHPMAEAMLRACDELGVYVMDELTDMWNRMKSNYDYGLYFDEWWEKDVCAMVRKDFNHPSVVLYSIGNEIPEIGMDAGSATAHAVSAKFHELDETRYTTAGINGVFAAGDSVPLIMKDILSGQLGGPVDDVGNVNEFLTMADDHMDEIVTHRCVSERLEKACASLDVAGYNYMTARYAPDREAYPNRVIVGSETYPPEIARNWGEITRFSHVIGDFTWTGWDYIGEAGVGIPGYHFGEGGFGAQFPAQLAYCGDIDLTGFRRPASYFREIVFGLRKDPYIAVQSPYHYGETLMKTPWVISDATHSWNFKGCEEKPVIVEVYAAGDEAELIQDGVSLGRKPSGKAAGFYTTFETVYRKGTLKAIVYENGEVIGEQELRSAGEAVTLCVKEEPWYRKEIALAEGSARELRYFAIELLDENGAPVTDADQEITVTAPEEVQIALGSGDPKPAHNYNERVTGTFGGRAQMIIVGPAPEGCIRIRTAAGLEVEV